MKVTFGGEIMVKIYYTLVLDGIKYPMKSKGDTAIATINYKKHEEKLIIRKFNELLSQ
jgi:hypothetical protein